ncbi:ficolin-1-like [Saccostrea echinata]|uniref:ficolin-1-like n=1 Tax=Saccostrea echinata TaxID=191078 RepID=UPI002A8147DF|nr:ficolin-1-like [Saccostrea echinata]
MMFVWTVFLMSSLLCASPQDIYLNDKNDCISGEEMKKQFQTILAEQRKLQSEVNKLQQDRELLTNLLTNPPGDCKTLYNQGYRKSGAYTIYPWERSNPAFRSVNVFCDMETNAGGWTAIQRRTTGAVNFNRNWTDYKVGFGITEDYWIGNDAIHQLTKDRPALYVSLTLNNVDKRHELYNQISVSDETDNYRLFLLGPASGTLGDNMLNTNRRIAGMPFTTLDRDNDNNGDNNCAVQFRGGWWFNGCHHAFLNGPWAPGKWVEPWSPLLMNGLNITETQMMIRSR